MLVEPDPVIAAFVEQLPGVEMLLIGAHRRVAVEILAGQRVGQLGLAALQMIEIGVVGQQVEDEDFHGVASSICSAATRLPRNANSAVATAAITAKPQALRKISRRLHADRQQIAAQSRRGDAAEASDAERPAEPARAHPRGVELAAGAVERRSGCR